MRLELTLRGDYAVRAMLAIARRDGGAPTPSRAIATEMDIPVGFLAHVLGDLVRAGLVTGTTGRAGGYRLARPAAEIDLLQVVDAIEGDGMTGRCVLRGGACRLDGVCAVHVPFMAATEALRRELRATSLATVAARSRALDSQRPGP
ncbi:MAG: Rrf2 family transcriptional regulator [Chloroflexi bacterium]|nr:Rrf2 family transcriptional regulator [Chloroflexota bacterium]